MGCCPSSSSQVTPTDSPVKRKSSRFQEKEITLSRANTQSSILSRSDQKKKQSPKKEVRPYVPVKVKPPPPKKEIEVDSTNLLEGHLQYVDLASWSPVSDNLITASSECRTIYWDVSRLPEQKNELSGKDMNSVISCIGWSQDGESFSLGHEDGKVSLWNKAGDHLFTWWPHEAPVNRVTLRGSGLSPCVLSAGDCAAVSQFIPGADLQELTQLYFSNSSDLSWVEWVDDETFLASDVSGIIELHHFDLGRLKKKVAQGKYEDKEKAHRRYEGHEMGVYQVKMKPGSSGTFGSCSVDNTIKIWDMRNKEEPLVHTLEDHLGYVTSIEWIPSTNKIISASFDYTLKIWDTKSGTLLHSLEKHRDAVTQFSLSPDSQYLVSASQDGDVHFWSVEDGQHINTFGGTGRIVQASWNQSGDKVVVTSYKTVTLLNIRHYPQARVARMQASENNHSIKANLEEDDPVEEPKHKKKHKKKKHR